MSTRRRFFQSIAAAIYAAALDINGNTPEPVWAINPDYEEAEFEDVLIFYPQSFYWVNPEPLETGLRYNFNPVDNSWEEVPEFIQLTPSQEPRN